MNFYIRLIVRPGVFLYYVRNPNKTFYFTTEKDNATCFESRDIAIENIKELFDSTNWKFNFEITTY